MGPYTPPAAACNRNLPAARAKSASQPPGTAPVIAVNSSVIPPPARPAEAGCSVLPNACCGIHRAPPSLVHPRPQIVEEPGLLAAVVALAGNPNALIAEDALKLLSDLT